MPPAIPEVRSKLALVCKKAFDSAAGPTSKLALIGKNTRSKAPEARTPQMALVCKSAFEIPSRAAETFFATMKNHPKRASQLTETLPDILARIVARKQSERGGARPSLADLERCADCPRRDFRAALLAKAPAIIAEIKKASPSKGLLSPNFDPAGIAREYESGGAAALSVLTDEHFFQGSLADLQAARQATAIPVLRKDFTLDEYHVVEAAAHGADAILLIVAILDARRIRALRELAAAYGMAALVETHSQAELDVALEAGADLIGVNNRDLRTFEVNLETSLRLAGRIPSAVVKVTESGIHSAADVKLLREAGFDAFLVGEHLMKSGSPAAALEALTGTAR
jgi:indole-3-glycerol phosphate synthase